MNALRYKVYKLYSMVAFAVPLMGLFAINKDTYISTASTGISFFGFILLLFFVIAFKNKILAGAKKDTLLTVIIGVFATALIMQYLAHQLMLISGAAFMGWAFSKAFDHVADVYYSRAYQEISDGRKVRIQTPTMPQKQAWRAAFGLSFSEV